MPEPEKVTRYELRITASGTVRDADGDVIGEQPIEATAILTEDELREQIERMTPE